MIRRQSRNPFDEAVLFSSLPEALRWAIDAPPSPGAASMLLRLVLP